MSRPQAVIFDIDGTTFHRDKGPGGRDPYDMTRVGEDLPNLPVLQIAKLICDGGSVGDVTVIFVSGRNEAARRATSAALELYYGPSFYLYMREENDMRPDETIKLELLHELQQKWDVIAAFDDRNRVVDMWRANGITCFQVCSREDGAF